MGEGWLTANPSDLLYRPVRLDIAGVGVGF